MGDWLHEVFRDRPWWMNAVMVFCAWMTFVYMPWDIFSKPVALDQEVWFGVTFTGFWAKLTALPHWFVYAAGLYGFRRRRPWMGFWSTAYAAQVSFGMFLWPILHWGSLLGFALGVMAAVPFALLAVAFWNAQDHFYAERVSPRERYGDWALVTGASAGLGMEFARALAREGIHCVLTARREERLTALAAELERQHGISTRTLAIDLAQPDGADRLADAVADLEIGILVNNAGFGSAGRFDLLEASRLRDMIAVNCLAPVLLTSRILPGMRARRRGAILITGSVAGRQPLPLRSVYSATKAFDLLFGEALWVELRGAGVDVLVLEPGSTQTEFQQVAGDLAHPGDCAEEVVAVALAALGQQPSVIPGWANWLRANAATRIGSRPLVAFLARQAMEVQTPAHLR